MTLSISQIRLFVFLLNFYLTSRGEWLEMINGELSDLFRIRSDIVRDEYLRAEISEQERDQQWTEIDHEISRWQKRLDDLQYEKFYLNKFEEILRSHLREEKNGLAA